MITKPRLSLILAIFLPILVFGQEFLGDSRNEIKKLLRGYVDSTYKISFSETIIQIDTSWTIHPTDTTMHLDTIANLKVLVDGFEKVELEYFFDNPNNVCDSIVVKFYCGKCADKHIKEFLGNKIRKWKKLDVDIYISRKWTNRFSSKGKISLGKVEEVGSPKMVIKREPDKPICVTVYFSIPMMDKQKWKQLTKK